MRNVAPFVLSDVDEIEADTRPPEPIDHEILEDLQQLAHRLQNKYRTHSYPPALDLDDAIAFQSTMPSENQ
jgi:hypothetical protein